MDIQSKIEDIAKKITTDPNLSASFASNPEKTIESILGVDLPDGAAASLVAGVKAKMNTSGLLGNITKLF